MAVGPAWGKDHREPSLPFEIRLSAPVYGHTTLLLYVGTIHCQVEALPCLYCPANLRNRQPNADGPNADVHIAGLLGYSSLLGIQQIMFYLLRLGY